MNNNEISGKEDKPIQKPWAKCSECDYSASRLSSIKRHKKAVHEGHRYMCDQYDYSVAFVDRLKYHKESKHMGIRYKCDQCDYLCLSMCQLKVHNERKHQELTYQCDLCDHVATYKSSLIQHKKNVHEGIRKDTLLKIMSGRTTKKKRKNKFLWWNTRKLIKEFAFYVAFQLISINRKRLWNIFFKYNITTYFLSISDQFQVIIFFFFKPWLWTNKF